MTMPVCGADPDEIRAALHGALLSDDEMADPDRWRHLPDPFGDWHRDPCRDQANPVGDVPRQDDGGGDRL